MQKFHAKISPSPSPVKYVTISKLTVHGEIESSLKRLSFFHVYFIIGVIFSLSYQSYYILYHIILKVV